jgi:hypothetical protein
MLTMNEYSLPMVLLGVEIQYILTGISPADGAAAR